MNDLFEQLEEIKKDLANLEQQIEGACYMVSALSPTYKFLTYIQRCVFGIHDKILCEIKTNKTYIPNCS